MFPLFHIGPYIEVHMFGLALVAAWVLFFGLLHRYCTEHGMTKNIFSNIGLYTFSIFFISRLVYIMTDWRNEKYIFIDLIEGGGLMKFLHSFFITENYNLSLAGGILGFLVIFGWALYRKRASFTKHIDILVQAFFWGALVGYTGSLLGGQVYGIYFDSFFSILYSDKNSIVPLGSARFPLPILYMIICLIGAFITKRIGKTMSVPDGFVGYIGFGFFGISLFLLEFLSGSSDMFTSYPPYININQVIGLIFISFSLIGIVKSIKI